MAKTPEEKSAKFRSMMGTRLPKAVKAIELLGNLSRTSDYAWTAAELQDVVDQLDDAVDGVLKAFGLDEGVDKDALVAGMNAQAAELDRIPTRTGGGEAPGVVYKEAHGDTYVYVGLEARDRVKIRDVLYQLTHNDVREGTRALAKIVCGWVVPDAEEA